MLYEIGYVIINEGSYHFKHIGGGTIETKGDGKKVLKATLKKFIDEKIKLFIDRYGEIPTDIQIFKIKIIKEYRIKQIFSGENELEIFVNKTLKKYNG